MYALKPAPENYQGTVFPYRGMQQHGVHPSQSVDPPDHMAEGGMVTVAPPHKGPDPVPVRIVQGGTKEYSQWRAFQAYVSGSPTQVVNRKENRANLTLRNLSDTVHVWIGPDANVTKQTGFRLDKGASFSLAGEAEIWAVSDDGTMVVLCGFFEFATET